MYLRKFWLVIWLILVSTQKLSTIDINVNMKYSITEETVQSIRLYYRVLQFVMQINTQYPFVLVIQNTHLSVLTHHKRNLYVS